MRIFVGPRKAFHTLDHEILKDKLYDIGIRGKPLKVIELYLSERVQYVQREKIQGRTYYSNFGVPHGTVLGPLFYHILKRLIPSELQGKQFLLQTTPLYCTMVRHGRT